MRTFRRHLRAPGGKLDDHPGGHLEIRAVQGKQQFKLVFVQMLT
jgi:hypothetical protein